MCGWVSKWRARVRVNETARACECVSVAVWVRVCACAMCGACAKCESARIADATSKSRAMKGEQKAAGRKKGGEGLSCDDYAGTLYTNKGQTTQTWPGKPGGGCGAASAGG